MRSKLVESVLVFGEFRSVIGVFWRLAAISGPNSGYFRRQLHW